MIFGNTVSGFSAPLGSVQIGIYSTSGYGLFLILAALVLMAATWAVLRFTPPG
jgi:branched-chain amino acid transport system permease protein